MPEKLEIILDEAAIADLNQLIGGFRHADALALTAFLNRRLRQLPPPHSPALVEGLGRPE
jgi:hypothetical protein